VRRNLERSRAQHEERIERHTGEAHDDHDFHNRDRMTATTDAVSTLPTGGRMRRNGTMSGLVRPRSPD